jgi:hypothetical protein
MNYLSNILFAILLLIGDLLCNECSKTTSQHKLGKMSIRSGNQMKMEKYGNEIALGQSKMVETIQSLEHCI